MKFDMSVNTFLADVCRRATEAIETLEFFSPLWSNSPDVGRCLHERAESGEGTTCTHIQKSREQHQ